MINAKIGNVTLLKSWISTTAKGNKGINLLSSGFSLMPGSASNTTMFIRVKSLKKLTLIYGAAGSYGKLFGEELITGLAISGFMYKGKLAKKLDATVIMACVYSPFTKYYTTDWFESTPIIVPFFNFNSCAIFFIPVGSYPVFFQNRLLIGYSFFGFILNK